MIDNWKYLLAVLALICAAVWLALIFSPDEKLHLVACDVGQGDAILASYKNGQILVDGGPDSKVLGCLSNHMPFWDRKIEVVILTHPQKDHFLGLIEVFKRYNVGLVVTTGLDSSSQEYQVLKEVVGGRGIKVAEARKGISVRLGLMQFDIVHPSEQFLRSEGVVEEADETEDPLGFLGVSSDVNKFSVVGVLRLGEFDALLTGDIDPEVCDLIAQQIILNDEEGIEYIKIPHHGSKNGLTEKLLEAVNPKIAVISVGAKNRYGHPHKEVLEMLETYKTRVFRTDEMGEVEVVSDGKSFYVRN